MTANENVKTEIEFVVIRDQGFGNVQTRVCDTREEAERELSAWRTHPTQYGFRAGEFRIQERPARWETVWA